MAGGAARRSAPGVRGPGLAVTGFHVYDGHNHQESLFSEQWTPTVESRLQVVAATDGQPAPFLPMEVQIDGKSLGTTALVRARLIVDWYSPRLEHFFRSEIVAPRYIVRGRASGPVLLSCPATTRNSF